MIITVFIYVSISSALRGMFMFCMLNSRPFHTGVRTQRRLKLKIIIIHCLLTLLLAHANNLCLRCNQLLTHKSCCSRPTIELVKCFFSVNSFFDFYFDALVAF